MDKISSALANSPSLSILNHRMDVLGKALEPFLLAGKDLTADPLDNNEVTADTLSRIQDVRKKLLAAELGNKATRYIGPVLDEIEQDARLARILPPQDQNGWAWSWAYDDWFRWDSSEKKWVSATQGWRMDFWS
ncbi:hypothetical protein N0V82_002631 [Gnomoniopsis sp. IMI 355080]|nr:hypothetical protein N0V82_002631 [Gnomoniopsis sp. IMI 355080]